ncbi:leucyl aminopeptidase [Chryseobacterium indologenes]|uniref:M28 family peptidase n=1 Tax=Chryseobacterium indologenes TaxID=253 RepID=UPI000BFCE4C2|nr:M28 family peptidase [Chryseobacterium indologenes]ATN05168.1 leucyl aminopeptidase [Chryseobacterium indologenes]AYY86077.1 M28 family peptidase [Chryseobacterium indologenes]QIX82978.1 M28 family peptidase [Chryseobacterium indologenes]UDQ52653.1 M28 family peptidase [Chryseobacterium indologenes]
MKKIAVLLLTGIIAQNMGAQSFIQAYQDRADMVTQTNITTNLQDFANLGIKTTGSPANTNALEWLKSKYVSFGYTAGQITEDPFTSGSISSINLVITKTGTLYPNKYVIVCGHFDSLNGPGVNDNGSGTSIILEAARILRDVPTEYSIKFIHFSGEEQGLLGSKHYANTVAYQGNTRVLDTRLVFNLDLVGGVMGNLNNTVYCDQDLGGASSNNAASATVTQELRNCTALYSPLQTAVDPAESTDYIPFEQKGEVITGFFERIRSSYPHTSDDTFDNTDPVYIYNIGKAAVGAIQHFAVATGTLGTDEVRSKNALEEMKISPNPAKDMIRIRIPDSIVKNFSFEITDLAGHSLLKKVSESEIDISSLENGAYIGILKSGNQIVVRKILVKK